MDKDVFELEIWENVVSKVALGDGVVTPGVVWAGPSRTASVASKFANVACDRWLPSPEGAFAFRFSELKTSRQ